MQKYLPFFVLLLCNVHFGTSAPLDVNDVITALKINEANENRAALKNPNLLIDNSLVLGSGDVKPQYPPSQSYVKPVEYVKPAAYPQPPAVKPVEYAPPPPPPPAPYQGYDDKQLIATGDQYKKSAEKYYNEFNQNSQIMTDSLKKIENIVVEVLNDQTRQKIQEDGGIRYKREANDDFKADFFAKVEALQREFSESEQKMGESLKKIQGLIAETIEKRKDEHNTRQKRDIFGPLDLSSPTMKNEKFVKEEKEPSYVDNVNMEVRITNKNNQDMWDVSRFLLDDGVRKSILEAIKVDLHLTNPDDLKGIDASMKKSFQKIRDEAVHVDKPDWMKEKPNHRNVISARVPIIFDPSKN